MHTSLSENAYNGLEIAIIGLACRFPGARNPEEFWQNIQNGVESLTHFSDDELASSGIDAALLADPNYVKVRGTLENIEYFDAAFFGYTPREAEAMDPQCRFFLECAWEALERAGYNPETYKGLIGVYAGSAWNSYLLSNIVPHYDPATLQGSAPIMFGNDKEYLTTRVSYKLNLQGPSVSVQSACSTSLVAVHQACQSLLSGECDMALAGGVSIGVPQVRGYLYQEEGIASPDGHCRAFDARAQGTTFSNGLGIVVLKRLADALASGDDIVAVIKGAALNNDGSAKVSFTAPGVEGQARVIRAAQQMAEVDAHSISYIEAHGTGTPLGDPIEIAALTQVFRETSDATGFCSIGSVKTNIGHVNTASGVAGLIKTALALKHRQLPPTLHFERPNPRIDFAGSPFYVNTTLTPWISTDGVPRRAGVSSFGIGGTNAHVVMEEAPSLQPGGAGRSWQILPLSARTDAAMETALDNLSAYLKQHPDVPLADVAYTLQVGRKAFQQRRAILCNDHKAATNALEQRNMLKGGGEVKERFIVFLFPGQGTQYVHMAEELYREEAIFRQQVDLCAEILLPHLKLDLREALFACRQEDAEERLNQTALAQPALFVIEYALSQLWMAWGVKPQAMIGHSIGEYVAACLAGVFSLEDALALVAERGHLMQAMPPGSMLAVPLSEEETRKLLCDRLSIAASNGPARCVVSGPEDEIVAFERRMAEQGLLCQCLYTSHAFHSDMMIPVVEPLMACLQTKQLQRPAIPYISNLTGTWITDAEATDPSYWTRHLLQTVRFCEGLKTLAQKPDALFLEVGPGQTLGTLTKPLLDPGSRVPVCASMRQIRERCSDLESIMKAVGQLWLAGVCIDWEKFHCGENRRRISLPTYPFERKKFWIAPPPSVALSHSATLNNTQKHVPDTFSHSGESVLQTKESTMPELHATVPSIAPRHARIAVRLRAIFSQLLGLEAQTIDPQATFLEMGADSLLLLQANQAIRAELHVTIPFRLMFDDYPTINDLAVFVDEKLPPDALPAPQEEHVSPTPEPTQAQSIRTAPVTDQVAQFQPAQTIPITDAVTQFQSARTAPVASIEHLLEQQLHVMSQLMSQQLDVLRTGHHSITEQVAGETKSVPPSVLQNSDRQPLPIREQQTELPVPAETTPDPSRGLGFSRQIKQETFVPYHPRQKRAANDLSRAQQEHLNVLTARYCAKTKESKRLAQTYRPFLADNKGVTGFRLPLKEMLYPLAVERAQGARMWDVDGNEYVDTAMGYGTLLFGHNPAFITETITEQMKRGIRIGPQSPMTGKAAQLLCEVTNKERATFCNSGTEAVMTALRIARATTGRPKIALFAGSYHGSFDGILVVPRDSTNKDGLAAPMAPGVPPHIVDDVMILRFDTPEALESIKAHAHELAAVLVEPRQSRRPDLQPVAFLQELRQLTQETGIALIFDEVVTGFRTHLGGVQGMLDIQADITTYGKALGGGIPISAIAGKAAFMDVIDGGFWRYGDGSYPETTETFFAGTYFKHPLVMPVVWSVLNYLKEQSPALQERLNRYTDTLTNTLNTYFEQQQIPMLMVNFGSLFRFVFPSELKGLTSDVFFYHLIEKGVYLSEGRNCFISTAHTEEDMHHILRAVKESIAEMQAGGFLVDPSLTPPTPEDDGVKAPRRATPYTGTAHVTADPVRGLVPVSTSNGAMQSFPLTEAQMALWLLSQTGENASCAYNESFTLIMGGQLNSDALHKSIQALVDRHEALRTTFSADGDYQIISPHIQIDLPLVDVSHVEAQQQEKLLSTWFESEIRHPFDFERGPLLRCYLLKKGEQDHLLVLMYHHIVVDGWSISVLLQELSKLYTAECQQRRCQLPDAGSFSEYARREKDRQQGLEMAAAERYWQAQFAAPVSHLELPSDRPRPPFQTFAGAQHRVTIARHLAQQLKNLSAQQHCTLYVTLLAAFQTLLYRLAAQEDFVVGIPMAGQPMQEGKGLALVGHCINLLPLRSHLRKDLTFAQHMKATRGVLLDAHEHSMYPFLRLIQTLKLPREAGFSPLFNVLFNFDRPSDTQEALRFSQLHVDGMTNTVTSSKYDLTLELLEADGEILADFTYSTDLFDAQTIERWSLSFLTLLQSVATDPGQPVSLLPILREEERTELLLVRNETRTDYARNACLHHLFEEQAARTPEAVAVEYRDERLTYCELNERANQLAHYLQKQGVKAGVCVGICMERSLEMLVGLLGIFKAGGAFLPLDPAFPQDRMAFMCADALVPLLLTQERLATRLPTARLSVLCLDSQWEKVAQERTTQPKSTVDGSHLAYIMYTSGSTGKPKGVLISHQGICNYLIWCAEAYGAAHGLGAPVQSSIAADAIFPSLFAPLLVGTRVVMLPESQSLESLNDVLHQRGGFSMIKITPTQLEVLNHQLSDGDARGWVRTLVVGAEAVRGDILHFWQEHAEGTILLNEYGPTETVVGCSIYHIPGDRLSTGPVPIGLPIANLEFYVLDEQMQLQPIGVPGELYIGGDGVAWGYLNRPELTAAVFVPHPFSQEPGARLYKTGDLVRYLPDRAGNIEFLGRIDHQVKIKGYRVELGEVEAALAEHETVEQVVVMARDDMAGAKQLVAYVVPAHNTTPQPDELRSFLQQKLPDYMLPAAFVLLDKLPLTATGKVDTRALPAPDRMHATTNKEFVPPQTDVEKQIAEIWSEVLHINKVGLQDNFFELRGDSLLATRVVARMRRIFHVELTLRHFFTTPTVAGLATSIEATRQQAQGDDEKIADFLKKVRQLSDQEISNLLAR